jgi:SAM-dependent methyltransferase
MRPAKIPVEETLAFIKPALPQRPASILDVGCGKGEIAAELKSLGFRVTALDVEREAVLLTRARGVEAEEIDFLQYDSKTPFDVLLFSRSLHHIAPLERAVLCAHALLKPGGTLIAEEFDVAAIDTTTALWHYDGLTLLTAVRVVPTDPDEDARRKLAPLERWRKEHEHDPPLHTGEEMVAALRERFTVVETKRAPFLYRTGCERVEESARGQRAAEQLLALERQGIERGELEAVGLRIVAKRA